MKFSKNVNNKKHAPKLIFFNEKKIEKDSDNFWRRKLTLKVRNHHFLITWFKAEVELTKNLFYEKVLFFHSINLPFDVQVAEKILNVIYYIIFSWSFATKRNGCTFINDDIKMQAYNHIDIKRNRIRFTKQKL